MILEIKSIYLTRNRRLIFDNFNLKLKKSQIMILLGKNGSGKTSLLDLIVGLIKPQKGLIKINGIALEELGELKKDLFTYLPHKDSLKENLTIKENLYIWLDLSNLKYVNLHKNLNFFDLLDLKNEQIRNLSQGQRKKVSLTKLLFAKTKLWLLDEPLNGLDIETIQKLKKLINLHTKNGGSTLMSSHINLGMKKCTKIILDKKNKLKETRNGIFNDWGIL